MRPVVLTLIRRLAPIVLLLAIWEGSAIMDVSNSSLIPSPVQIGAAIREMITSGQLVGDVAASLRRVLLGFGAAVLTGCILGTLITWLGNHADWLNSPLELLRPIPPIAWIPLTILWFGIGETPAYFIVFIGAFFPILTNVVAGIRSTEQMHINAARCLGASRGLILREVVLPSALPNILTGCRVGLGVGWICVITAELVGAQSGLGYMIQINRLLLRTDKVMAGMVIIGSLGFAFNRLLIFLEKRLVPWRTAQATT